MIRVADLNPNQSVAFTLTPDRETCRQIATQLGLVDLKKLRFAGTLNPKSGSSWHLSGHLGATVVQPCIVTLDPVTTRLEEDVERLYRDAEFDPLPDAGSEIEMPEDDSIEALGATIDLGAVMREALALALPLYPRSADAALSQTQFAEPGVEPLGEGDLKPFAGLQALKDRMTGEPEN